MTVLLLKHEYLFTQESTERYIKKEDRNCDLLFDSLFTSFFFQPYFNISATADAISAEPRTRASSSKSNLG